MAIISRDSESNEYYSDYAKYSFEGIDCGFFINEWFNPPKINESFIAAAFDKIDEPQFDTSNKIIRLHHSPNRTKEEFFNKPNTIISDNLKDYLTVYSNAIETHSDRVHACVASIAYGIPTKLYFNTPRAKLFNKLIKEDITQNLVKLDKDILNKHKNEQVTKLSKILKEFK